MQTTKAFEMIVQNMMVYLYLLLNFTTIATTCQISIHFLEFQYKSQTIQLVIK